MVGRKPYRINEHGDGHRQRRQHRTGDWPLDNQANRGKPQETSGPDQFGTSGDSKYVAEQEEVPQHEWKQPGDRTHLPEAPVGRRGANNNGESVR